MALEIGGIKNVLQHLAIHVLAHGQAQVIEHGRREVEHRGACNFASATDVRAGGQEDPLGLVIQVGLVDIHHFFASNPPVAALESVIGEDEDGGLFEIDLRKDAPQ